jgi:hypothetical protein
VAIESDVMCVCIIEKIHGTYFFSIFSPTTGHFPQLNLFFLFVCLLFVFNQRLMHLYRLTLLVIAGHHHQNQSKCVGYLSLKNTNLVDIECWFPKRLPTTLVVPIYGFAKVKLVSGFGLIARS